MENSGQTAECRFDLLGIGNAIVDVLAPVEADFPHSNGMTPGSMTLIDAARAQALYNQITREKEMGGGSAANTCVVASNMGARVAYLARWRMMRRAAPLRPTCRRLVCISPHPRCRAMPASTAPPRAASSLSHPTGSGP